MDPDTARLLADALQALHLAVQGPWLTDHPQRRGAVDCLVFCPLGC